MASQGFQKKMSFNDALTWDCQHSACAGPLLLPCVLGSVWDLLCSPTGQHVIIKMMMMMIKLGGGGAVGGEASDQDPTSWDR